MLSPFLENKHCKLITAKFGKGSRRYQKIVRKMRILKDELLICLEVWGQLNVINSFSPTEPKPNSSRRLYQFLTYFPCLLIHISWTLIDINLQWNYDLFIYLRKFDEYFFGENVYKYVWILFFLLVQLVTVDIIKWIIHFVVGEVKFFHLTSFRIIQRVFFYLKICHFEIWIVQQLENGLKLLNLNT